MKELYNIGISEDTIKSMVEMNQELLNMKDEVVIQKEELLKNIECSDTQILNIISSNPMFLSRSILEIERLLAYLNEIGFKTLNILLDANPYILNLEPFEIDDYINKRKNSGESLEDIIDNLDAHPCLFSEM